MARSLASLARMNPLASVVDVRTAQSLVERVRADAENRPGVYRFAGSRGEVLYVGKSVRIRSRLLSYFRPDVPPKVSELLRVSAAIHWDYVPNEFEAVLRELKQIRAFRPTFNRHHRIERRFAWIRVTSEPASRLVAARRRSTGGETVFGPFPAPRGLPALLRELAVATGVRDCAAGTRMFFADQVDLFGSARVPSCARADLGTCPAPCAERCTRAEYDEGVVRAIRFLNGDDDSLLLALNWRMDEEASRHEFERAALYRDRVARFQGLRDEIVLFRQALANLSFVYRVPSTPPGDEHAYVIHRGRVVWSFSLSPSPPTQLAERLERALSEASSEAVDDSAREEAFLVARWFRLKPEELERTVPFDRVGTEEWHRGSSTCNAERGQRGRAGARST
jgi:excinuclease ABC subunit C